MRPAKGIVQVLPGHLTAGCTFPVCSRGRALVPCGMVWTKTAAETKKRKEQERPVQPFRHQARRLCGAPEPRHRHVCGHPALEVQGAIKDYLKVQYSGSDVLYVPVTQLDLLSRYTAPATKKRSSWPSWAVPEWQRTVPRSKATEEMAQELIELGARRRQATGYAPSRPTATGSGLWRPVSTTTKRTIDSTPPPRSNRTWKKGYPMDRLLCGDVGVGKTESSPAGRLQVRDGR